MMVTRYHLITGKQIDCPVNPMNAELGVEAVADATAQFLDSRQVVSDNDLGGHPHVMVVSNIVHVEFVNIPEGRKD